MLLSLYIENFILIEKTFIEFGSGFSVLTGETGAGKSIILDALQIVLGGKTSAKVLRNSDLSAVLIAEFNIADNQAVLQIMNEMELPSCDTLVIRRVVGRDGKTKAFVNDAMITMPLLQQLGDQLLEIFGQNDHHSLMSSSMHRDTLDAYLRLSPLRQEVSVSYKGWQEFNKKLEEMRDLQSRSNSEQDYLQHVVAELEGFNYRLNEEEELGNKRQKMMDYGKCQEILKEANDVLYSGAIIQQMHKLQKILGRKPELFTDAIAALERGALEMEEAQAQLESVAQGEHDDLDLASIENRFFAIKSMAKKYGIMIQQLPEFLQESKGKLSTLSNIDDAILEMEKKCSAAKQIFDKAAGDLSARRVSGASSLEQVVIKELKELHMAGASFFVKVEPMAANQHGVDKVYFEVLTNPDSKPDALQNIASGGEISRIMLALKVALADVKSIDTMIFDEVDAGIGGVVAGSVGKKLAKLGAGRQILAITHQPQIAACAAHQYHVSKALIGGITKVGIKELDPEERVQEISRMLAGDSISSQAREAAVALLGSVKSN